MTEFRAVVFDVDDTLYPEIDYVRSGLKVASNLISSAIGVCASTIYSELLMLYKENSNSVFNRFLCLYGVKDEVLISDCVATFRNHSPSIALPYATERLLHWLIDKGIKIGIITDGRPEGQRNKIKALGLEKLCDHIIVTDELGGPEFRKPCELPYKIMLENLAVTPKEAIYVGDNPAKDFVAANVLGMTTVMLNQANGVYKQIGFPVEYTAQYNVWSLDEIKGIIERRWDNAE